MAFPRSSWGDASSSEGSTLDGASPIFPTSTAHMPTPDSLACGHQSLWSLLRVFYSLKPTPLWSQMPEHPGACPTLWPSSSSLPHLQWHLLLFNSTPDTHSQASLGIWSLPTSKITQTSVRAKGSQEQTLGRVTRKRRACSTPPTVLRRCSMTRISTHLTASQPSPVFAFLFYPSWHLWAIHSLTFLSTL